MLAAGDLIDFNVIEEQKENIQSLPGGRSAKKLVELFSPSPLHKLSTPTPSDTKNINDCIRAEYEAEIQSISESDDPLDVYDRYVRWNLDAFPSAQATPQSQLHLILERATKAFLNSAQYKNDPRYLKFWMYYIRFFSDAPRETYMFLSRHGIGDALTLFYEEYAAWLEGAGRWAQAAEVYKLGIERGARPGQRLLRKYQEFEQRLSQQPESSVTPSSPALPAVRPALAAKIDPFHPSSDIREPRVPQRQAGSQSGAAGRPNKSKLAVFSDADAKPSTLSTRNGGSQGWETVGTLAQRKKENLMEPKAWVGETLQTGKRKATVPKLTVFRDSRTETLAQMNKIFVHPSQNQVTVHPQTGKKEYIFVDLAAVYPTPDEYGTELSFEEIVAAARGWLDQDWEEVCKGEKEPRDQTAELCPSPRNENIVDESSSLHEKLSSPDRNLLLYDENGTLVDDNRRTKPARKKIIEVNETQISEPLQPTLRQHSLTHAVKAKLDSPSRPKIRKRSSAEPTMTLHTKAATDDIYEIFNAPPSSCAADEGGGCDEDGVGSEADYTTDVESTGTTRHVESEPEDQEEDDSDTRSVSAWSDFSAHKHIPLVEGEARTSDCINQLPDVPIDAVSTTPEAEPELACEDELQAEEQVGDANSVDERSPPMTQSIFIPLPPEDFDAPTHPFRSSAEMANNRLPFMTPITERTEFSLDVEVNRRSSSKTPCGQQMTSSSASGSFDLEPMSSALREIVEESEEEDEEGGNSLACVDHVEPPVAHILPVSKTLNRLLPPKGPLVKEKQCNPVDEALLRDILDKIFPPLTSCAGFFDHRSEAYGKGNEIRRFFRALSKINKGGTDRGGPLPDALILRFPGTRAEYSLKRELGAGAFAPVYLVGNSKPEDGQQADVEIAMGKGAFAISHREALEAVKMEAPPTAWEFHMLRTAHSRLGPQHRATTSLTYAHEMYLYRDEAFLFLPYHPNGTLLDVVNCFRSEPSGVMDEQLAIFFAIELLRTAEALHTKSILHGDIKPDNCLLRLDAIPSDAGLTAQWRADGSGSWGARGIVLIDFGRSIDMKAFVPDVEFIADWKPSAQDCVEIREGRSWTWQIDYHGLAGTIHCLLFGKYMETNRCDQGGIGKAGRRYRIRETLKRYWQTELWAECFELLLNPAAYMAAEEGGRLPVLRSIQAVRQRMETWLEQNSEKGVGLRALMGKVESHAKSRK